MQVIIQFLKDMSPVRIVVAALTVLVFLILFAIYLSKINNDEYSILYSDLDIQDSARVVQELDTRRIEYQAISDGSVIKVHKSEVIQARLELAQVGLPNSGSVVGYEIFDKDDSIGATNFSQNVKLVRALEGELARTISAFDEIEKARVHLVMPQREIFSREKTQPRASVVLRFKGNRKLGKSQINAISHLVVTAVPDLEMGSVTIVDTKGRALKVGSSEEGSDYAGAKNEEIRIAEEQRLRKVIEGLLESTLGSGKVKATVSLDMNFDRVVTNSETYDPDSAVIRSVQSADKREQTPVGGGDGGDASVANNIPGGAAGGSVDSSKFAIIEESDSTTNYEISKVTKNHISETGMISRMSIGILVDGIYTAAKDSEDEEKEYNPRSQDDLDKIKNLVTVAVGFDEDRGDKIEVVNMRFSEDLDDTGLEATDWLKEELPSLFQTLIFAIVVLLVLITVIRPIALKAFEVKKANESDENDFAAVGGLARAGGSAAIGPDGQPILSPDGSGLMSMPDDSSMPEIVEKSENPLEKVNEFAESNPQDLVNVLRKWMNEDG